MEGGADVTLPNVDLGVAIVRGGGKDTWQSLWTFLFKHSARPANYRLSKKKEDQATMHGGTLVSTKGYWILKKTLSLPRASKGYGRRRRVEKVEGT